jgi:nicotinamide-nucleotide amidase
MQAIIISVGDELVLGQTVDTNSAHLSSALAALGIATMYHQTIGDDRAAIGRGIAQAAEAAELVLVTGGLGPTDDDLTREALADALGADLVEDEASVAALSRFFAGRGRPMPPRNRVQAQHPRGTTVIANSCGTAPGIYARLHRAHIFVMPGVPSEMRIMFDTAIKEQLQSLAGDHQGVILTEKVNTFGRGESAIAELLGELMDRQRNPKVGTTVTDGIVCVRVRSEFATREKAQAELERTVELVERRLGPVVFGRDEQTLQEAVVAQLREAKRTLVTAESCTGGLMAAMLTDVPGCSDVFHGGWVTYRNEVKSEQLGVEAADLAAHGAVSEPVARAMARGAVEKSGSDFALAVTGIAGPTGGTAQKPVGTVWLALASRQADGSIATHAALAKLHGDRTMVRDRAAKCGLQLLRFYLLGCPMEHLQWAAAAPAKA